MVRACSFREHEGEGVFQDCYGCPLDGHRLQENEGRILSTCWDLKVTVCWYILRKSQKTTGPNAPSRVSGATDDELASGGRARAARFRSRDI
jgi:hypothetical protein